MTDDPPRLLFFIPPDVLADGHGNALIVSVIVTAERKLVMADYTQSAVRMSLLERPDVLEDTLAPGLTSMWSLVQMSDGIIAVTSWWVREIHLIKINGSKLELVKKIKTTRYYAGVADFADGTLIVSSLNYLGKDARIDIITRSGDVLQTILSTEDTPDLGSLFCLTRSGRNLYVSDWTSNRVFRVDLETREATAFFGDMDLSRLGLLEPRVVGFDDSGNMYLATGGDCM